MTTSRHLILVATSKLSVNELLAKITDKDGVIQLFDPNVIACREHLEFAYLNSVKIHDREESRSKSASIEMLLCTAMTSQISDAIKKVGAKTGKEFIVFSDNKKAYSKISGYLINPLEFKPSKKEIEERLIRLGIKSQKIEDLIQEIALKAMER